MKKLFYCIFFFLIFVCTHLCFGDFLSFNLITRSVAKMTKTGEKKDVNVPVLRFSPSVSLDFYLEETKTKKSSWQISPGVGYGIRWNPAFWDNIKDNIASNYFLAFDLFFKAFPSEENKDFPGYDYFNIDILPTITLFDWISIGYGWRFKRAQHPELEHFTSGLFCFGIRKAL